MMINSIHTNNTNISPEQYWQEHIQLKNKSGISGAAYCRQHNLTVSTFYYWEQKLNNLSNSKPLNLMPVKVEQPSISEHVLCSLTFKNGNQLKIHDPAALPALISILS